MELEQQLRALQPGIQAPGSDDRGCSRVAGGGREAKADVGLGMGF